MRRNCALVSLAAAVLLAACSSSTPKAAETPSPSPSPTATPTTTPTTTPVAPPSPTTSPSPTKTVATAVPHGSESPAPLGQPVCKASAVTVTDADTVVKPRYRAEVLVLRTTGAPCQLNGYPSVFVQGATVTRGGEGLPPETPRPATLSRGTSLSFALATARTGTCRDTRAITVVLPGTTQPKGVLADVRICNGRLGVSPVHRLGDDE